MEMKTVISTCSPYACFERVLPILHQAGLELDNVEFTRWHDELFGPSCNVNSHQFDKILPPNSQTAESIPSVLTQEQDYLRLLADTRCLWTLDILATKIPSSIFLLFYTSAESALANACLQNIEPQLAFESWQIGSRHLLDFQRRHRRQVLLIDAEVAIRQPHSFIDTCQKFGVPLKFLPQSAPPLPEENYLLERYLGHQLLANNLEVQSLRVAFEASAPPFCTLPHFEIEPLDLFNHQRQRLVTQYKLQQELGNVLKKLHITEHALEERNKDSATLDTLKESNQILEAAKMKHEQENQLLLLQLHSVQEQLEDLTISHDQQRKLNKQYLAQLQNMKRSNHILEEAKMKHEQENQLLLLQLHTAQEQLDKTTVHENQLLELLQSDKKKQLQLQTQFKNLTISYDQLLKLNKQHLSQLQDMKRSNYILEEAKKHVAQENETLLLQLHQVQEELEIVYLQRNRLEIKTKEELLKKEQELTTSQIRIANLKQSVSWKITSPLRSISRPFNLLSKQKKKVRQQINLLKNCSLFDEAWYVATNQDVAQKGFDPVEHYILYGAVEGRNPSLNFNTLRYLEINADVAEAGMNPLVHFVKFGMSENRIDG
jgi:hypothetical protein